MMESNEESDMDKYEEPFSNINGSNHINDLVKKFNQMHVKMGLKLDNGFKQITTRFDNPHSKEKTKSVSSTFETYNPDVLDPCSLEMLAIESPVSIFEKLQMNSVDFFQLLNDSDYDSNLTIVVVKILAKMCNHNELPLQKSFITLLCKVLKSKLFTEQISRYLMAVPLKYDFLWQFHLTNTLKNLATFFKLLVPFRLSHAELKCIGYQLVICKDSTKKLDNNFLDAGVLIAAEFEQLISTREDRLKEYKEDVVAVALDRNVGIGLVPEVLNETFPNGLIGAYCEVSTPQVPHVVVPGVPHVAAPQASTVAVPRVPYVATPRVSTVVVPRVPYVAVPKGVVAFRHITVYPTESDMMTKPTISPNIIQGPYKSVDHYLHVQFQLMREDLLGPLRDAMKSSIEKQKTGNKNVYVCRDITVGRPTMTLDGIIFELRCQSQMFSGAGREGNKMLTTGSMLCVSSNDFKSFSVAVVKPTFGSQLRSGIIKVEFLEPHSFIRNFNSNRRYMVIESPSYYEAYKHVLLGLQTLNERTFPLKKYIVDVETTIGVPKYLKPGTCYRLPFASGESSILDSFVEVLDCASWPSAEQLGLDKVQLVALQMALTRDLAIIQGPPGTGKTFIGLKIVETLLHNEHVWNGLCGYAEKSPILVVCYTNHALDQFLEGVLKFCPSGVVRIGGRSKSELVSQHNLRNKQLLSFSSRWQLRDLYCKRDTIRTVMREAEFMLNLSIQCIHLKTTLRQYMLPRHYNQFSTYEDTDDFDQFPYLEIWLEVVDFQEDNVWNAGWKSGGSLTCYTLRALIILRELRSEEVMQHVETQLVDDVWSLTIKDRWRLYRFWNSLLRKESLSDLESSVLQFRAVSQQVSDIRFAEDVSTLKAAKLIGMTTTGAAKNLKVIQEVGAKIVVIEEAAKVFESHALMSVSEDCQHVIMIGDHQQLRPTPNDYDLAERCHLDVSMFERLIKNKLPFETLSLQHRMRPEIASLLVPHIYKELRNHHSVEMYDDIRGFCSNMYFVDHSQMESRVEHSTSRSNTHEAAFISSLCRYIVNQGYEPQQITVLTTYLGQLATIESAMCMKGLAAVHCASVDNYQGEENDIILLSLVRSNQADIVGFMKTTNRVCVAMSRAKMGFYCIGNFSLLGSSDTIWKPIVNYLRSSNFIGRTIKLRCSNHPDTITEVAIAEDFLMVPEGGCSLLCEETLNCGHQCQLHCHGYDKQHEKIKCGRECEQMCPNEHRCSKLCWEECGSCLFKVFEIHSDCGHENMVCCYQLNTDILCQNECSEVLSCGHQCSNKCGEPCSEEDCRHRCSKILACGHLCQSLCGRPCTQTCVVPAEKLLSCGHKMMGQCGLVYTVSDCREQVTVTAPCGHEVAVCCSRTKDMKHVLDTCSVPCMEELSCGHLCSGTCGICVQGRAHKECPVKCNLSLVCGHQYLEASCLKDFEMCNKKCLIKCSHECCPYPCSWPCKPCHRDCAWKCSHYKCHKKCFEVCDRPPCNESCTKRLPCGHSCIGLCGEVCPSLCRICDESKVKEVFFGTEQNKGARFIHLVDCGHVFEVTALDRWMELRDTSMDGPTALRAKTCPKCNVAIFRTFRYNKSIKTFLHNYNFIKNIIFKFVDEFTNSFPDVIKRWQKVFRSQVMFVTDSNLVEEKRKRLDEWALASNKRGGPTPKQGLQFYREFLRILYLVSFKSCCHIKYESVSLEARSHYDKIWTHLTATYQFTVLVEDEVKEQIAKLKKCVYGMTFEIDKFEMSKVFTRRPNWFKCAAKCGNIFYQTKLENAELINGCPLCRSSGIPQLAFL